MKTLLEIERADARLKIVKERYGEIGIGIFCEDIDGNPIRNAIFLEDKDKEQIIKALSE